MIARADAYANLSEHGRYLAEHIAGARFVTFPGTDLVPWAGEFDSIVDELEEFVTGARGAHAPTRLLATVLFTDIVDSTVRAAAAGDRQWRAVLDEFDVNVARLLARHDGVLVKIDGRRDPGPLRRAGAGGALCGRDGGRPPGARISSCGPGCTPARWSCAATTSAAWPCTSRRG